MSPSVKMYNDSRQKKALFYKRTSDLTWTEIEKILLLMMMTMMMMMMMMMMVMIVKKANYITSVRTPNHSLYYK